MKRSSQASFGGHFFVGGTPVYFETPADQLGGTTEPPEGTTPPVGDTITIPVDEPPQNEPPAGTINPDLLKNPEVQAAIEEARRQEKEKVYGRLETAEQKLQRLEAEREEQRRADEEARQAAEAEAARAAEEEMSVRDLLAKKEREWEDRFAQAQRDAEEERAVFAMERRYQELQTYRQSKIAEHADDLMPELADLINGNSEEEIDRSVDEIKARSLRIVQQMQAQTQQQRQQQRGAAPTGQPVGSGPMEDDSAHQTLTLEDLRGMDMDFYSKNRDKLLESVSQKARTQGIYGP